MGTEIDRERFSAQDYAAFRSRLLDCLVALEQILGQPGFGEGERTLGAELELALVDSAGWPLPLNRRVLDDVLDPRLTVELDKFNLECNLQYSKLSGPTLRKLRAEIDDVLGQVRRAASRHGGLVTMIGILPTLRGEDLQSSAMTESRRYRALSYALRELRTEPFRFHIDGLDPLQVACDDVTFEGAATSLQIHLRVDPIDFTSVFNAAQLATAPALAVCGNSPTFLGHRLWEETRVALFKQAVDDRNSASKARHAPARVSFGSQWVKKGAGELFQEAVRAHEVLLPLTGDQDPLRCLAMGELPRLDEIRLHQGTVWRWNRAIYDPAAGGHLRIELRALPAGPTVEDMLANTAFLVGLSLGLAPRASELIEQISFEEAHTNFYRAAQRGLDATLMWPDGGATRPVFARDLIPELLETARRGLLDAEVDTDDVDACLAIIAARCESGQTGAVWQRRSFEARSTTLDRYEALRRMLLDYMTHSDAGAPVHLWPAPGDR